MEILMLFTERATGRLNMLDPVVQSPRGHAIEWPVVLDLSSEFERFTPLAVAFGVAGRPQGIAAYHRRVGQEGLLQWHLAPHELQSLEEQRAGRDLQIELQVTGLAMVAGRESPEMAQGDVFLRIPKSDWATLLEKLEYMPGRVVALPISHYSSPNWEQTMIRLAGARRAVEVGEGHEAMRECLTVLEGLHSSPYNPKAWEGMFNVDPQKAEGLEQLFSGVATYLNKVGHHRSRSERDEDDVLRQSRVEHYEAELLVAMTHLLLAYAARLPKTPSESAP
jgi:hypothetical protein